VRSGRLSDNDYKADHWSPDSIQRILHPLRDPLAEHIGEREDGTLVALTDTGRFHIERLRLNRPQLLEQRQRHRELQDLRQQLQRLEAENRSLRLHIQAVEEQIRLLLEQMGW
jgi:predicted RNase H-like nuclease (RuvC/YqgF family)